MYVYKYMKKLCDIKYMIKNTHVLQVWGQRLLVKPQSQRQWPQYHLSLQLRLLHQRSH